MRHLAFPVDSVSQVSALLETKQITVEPIKINEFTGKIHTLFINPDSLSLQIYQV